MLKIIETKAKELGDAISLGAMNKIITKDVLDNATVYCIKNCLRPGSIDNLREIVIDHYRSIPQIKMSKDASTCNLNYHSIEKGVSAFQKTLHYFHAYVFNNIADLPLVLSSGIKGLFSSLVSFHNELTCQNRPPQGNFTDGKQFRPQIFRYPAGGGMFAAHVHPLEPQKLGIVLGLSRHGRDFKNGGAGFEAPDGALIDTGPFQDIGDIVIFRYNLKHCVTPCDINEALDDSKMNGRWSAVIPIY